MYYSDYCGRCKTNLPSREETPPNWPYRTDDNGEQLCAACHHYMNSELCVVCDSPIIHDGNQWVHEAERHWCDRPTYDLPGLWVGVIHRDRTSDLIVGPFNGLRAGHQWARSMRVACGFNPVADPSTIVDTHHIWVYGTELDDYEKPEPVSESTSTTTRRTFRQRLMFWRNQHD